MAAGDLNYLYEPLFWWIETVQWNGVGADRTRRTYALGAGVPFKMYFSTSSTNQSAIHPTQINCCGSTICALYLEMERKVSATESPPQSFEQLYDAGGDSRAKCPSLNAYAVWLPYHTDYMPDALGDANEAQREGVKRGIEEFGVGFGLADRENIRRGDGVQIWWNGWSANTAGHNVFVWDVAVGSDGNVYFQELSAQPNTGGVGIYYQPQGNSTFLPVDYEYCKNLLIHRPEDVKKSAWTRPIEIHGARFYRFFPYWPLHIWDVPTDRTGFGRDAAGGFLGQGGLLVGGPTATTPELIQDYYANNEGHGLGNSQRAGGFYPIGSTRTWHGGIHLYPKDAHAPLYAVSDGVIIAGRCATNDPLIGPLRAVLDTPLPSRDFVLIRHQVKLDGTEHVFFCLYMHIDNSRTDATLMESRWLWKLRNLPADNATKALLDAGGVVRLAEPVAAGDIVGHVAAPDEGDVAKVHVEIFSLGADPIITFETQNGKKVEDDNADLFVDNAGSSKELFEMLEDEMTGGWAVWDDVVTAEEICEFFATNEAKRGPLRYYVCRHVSEWSLTGIDWSGIADKDRWGWEDPAAMEQLESAIRTYGWWDETLGEHGGAAGLGNDHKVWTYHPVTLLAWLQTKVVADPTGKQIEQDVKSFLPTAKDCDFARRGAAPSPPVSQPGTGGGAPEGTASVAGMYLVTTDSKALTTFGDIAALAVEGLKVHYYFKSVEEKAEGSNVFHRVSAWVAVGTTIGYMFDASGVADAPSSIGDGAKWVLTSSGRVCFEDNGGPGKLIELTPNSPTDVARCAVVKGTLTQVGDHKDVASGAITYRYVKFSVWVSSGTTSKPEMYATKLADPA